MQEHTREDPPPCRGARAGHAWPVHAAARPALAAGRFATMHVLDLQHHDLRVGLPVATRCPGHAQNYWQMPGCDQVGWRHRHAPTCCEVNSDSCTDKWVQFQRFSGSRAGVDPPNQGANSEDCQTRERQRTEGPRLLLSQVHHFRPELALTNHSVAGVHPVCDGASVRHRCTAGGHLRANLASPMVSTWMQ